MIASDQSKDRRALRVQHINVLLRRDAETHGDIGGALADTLRRNRRRGHVELEMRSRVRPQKARENLRQKLGCNALRTRQTNRRAAAVAQPADLLSHALRVQQTAPRMLGKQTPGFAQHHPARPPFEKHRADFLLQLRDLSAQRRHGNV
jgi:hypothetical protein